MVTRNKIIFSLLLGIICSTATPGSSTALAAPSKPNSARTVRVQSIQASAPRAAGTAAPTAKVEAPNSFAVSKAYATKMLNDVDKIVNERFYDRKLAADVWPQAREKHRLAIESSTTLTDLARNINAALHELKSSHTLFVTINDEAYYFLLSLFFRDRKDVTIPAMTFTGAITGGVDCADNQVRYILDASPAQEAGLKPGDLILEVNGKPLIGQLSFEGTEKTDVKLRVQRDGSTLDLTIKPISARAYPMYVQAIKKSIRTVDTPDGKIGYVHLWSGGEESHDAWEECLQSSPVQACDALVVDFRDGYGGNNYDDLDFFYRPAKGYPPFEITNRKGHKHRHAMFFDKPVVALINGGARSGKELISYSLKQTGRAKLVGTKTAGAVLAGTVFPLGARAALYLAVSSGTVNGAPLEGNGVEPDVLVQTTPEQRGIKDIQYQEAERLLREELAAKRRAKAPGNH